MTRQKGGGLMRGTSARVAPGRTPRCGGVASTSYIPCTQIQTLQLLCTPSFTSMWRCVLVVPPFSACNTDPDVSPCMACRWSATITSGAMAAGTATATCAERTWRRRACATSATPSRSTACRRAAGSTRTEGCWAQLGLKSAAVVDVHDVSRRAASIAAHAALAQLL